jgi:fluoride ion exporter CrcB/FEX
LVINIIGSTFIGYVAAKLPFDANNLRALIITGVLGGFTTFSAFSECVAWFGLFPLSPCGSCCMVGC